MKTFLFTLIALILILSAKAQKKDTLKGLACDKVIAGPTDSPTRLKFDPNKIYTAVEIEPRCPEFHEYLKKNLRVPQNIPGGRKRVLVSFVVEKDGYLTDVSPELDAEAVKLMKGSPKWVPGVNDDRRVRVLFMTPISFEDDKIGQD
jgi:protein TonB